MKPVFLTRPVCLVLLAFLTSCPAPGPTDAASDLLVIGATVVTMSPDLEVFDPGFVAVRQGRIAAVGPASEAASWSANETIDATGKLVLPGLINGHQHAPMVLFRGLGSDLKLMDWLEDYIFPAEAKTVDEEFVYWGTLLSALEMISGGTTLFADMYYYEAEVARAIDESGMRGVLGQTIIGFPAPDHPTPEETLAYTERFIRDWKDHGRVIPAVAPHAPFTVSREVLLACRALADKYDVPLLIHLAETSEEVSQVEERTGDRPIRYLEKIGFLSDRVVANHGVWALEDEIELFKKRGVGVIHNPESNMKLASGVAPVPGYFRAGVDLGLGTDGAASNNNLDLFEEMDSMAKLHKLAGNDPTLVPARAVLIAATLGGARALDLDDRIGSLEPGKQADLIIIGLDSPAAHPRQDPYSLAVYTLKASSVETVIVAGETIYRDRRFTRLEPERIYRQAADLRSRVEAALR